MKKLVYSLMAAGLAFAACTDFDEEKSEVFNDAEATVSVDIKAVDDYTVEISVTPGQTATRYAYAMVEGQYAAEDITEDDVLDMTSGILDSKKVPSVSKKVDGLNPNTPYTVFAIAYSEHNHAGKVAAKSVVTSDKLAPEFKESKATASGIILTFSEDIVLADASKVSAAVYNEISDDYFASEVTVKVAGNQALVSAKDAKPGSYVFVSWEEGAFVDNAGLPVEAQVSGVETEDLGVYGQIPNVAFDIAVDTVVVESASGLLKGDAKLVFVTSKDCPELYGNNLTAKVTISNSTVTSTIKTEVMVEEDNNFSVMLPEAAVAGQSVSIVIEANSFVDECGNGTKELKCSQNFMVAFSIEEIEGLYTVTYKSGKDTYRETWALEAIGFSNGLYKMTISGMLAGALDNPTPCVAYFDPETGTLILLQGPIGSFGNYGNVFVLDEESGGEEYFEMSATAAGVIESGASASFVYYIPNAGILRSCAGVTMIRR